MSPISPPVDAAWEQAAPPGRRWVVTRHTYGVLGVMLLTAGVYLTLLVQTWRRVAYRAFDSVIFDQAVRGYSRFEAPRVPLKGAYAGLGHDFIQLGDHFSPIHALLAPLYWIWDDVRMLFIAQAVMYAIAAGLIWRFTRRVLGVGPAYLVAVAFGLSFGLQSAMVVGYHELDCAVVLLAFTIERLHAGRHRPALVGAALLLLVKEEMGLLIAVLGLLFLIRGHRRWGIAVSVVGLVWSALAIKVFVPSIGGNSQQYWTYRSFGSGPVSAATFILTHPGQVVQHVTATDDRRLLLLWLIAVALGAYLLSPITLLALPSLALRLLSDQDSYASVHWQYNAPLMVILLMGGVDGISRLAGWTTRVRERTTGTGDAAADAEDSSTPPASRIGRAVVWTWAVGLLVVAGYGCTRPEFAMSRIADAASWHQTSFQRAAFAVVDQIPRDATVEADDNIGVLISSRTRNLVMVDGKRHGSQYVVLGEPVFPFWSREQIVRLKQDYLSHGYQQVWQEDYVCLLRRSDS